MNLHRLSAPPEQLPPFTTQAACASEDPHLFYGPDLDDKRQEDRTVRRYRIRAAKATCATCPVLHECRTWGVQYEAHGVWGGLDEHEREALRRNHRRQAAA